MLRLMPEVHMLESVLEYLLQEPIGSCLPVLGLILQQTDSFNFTIMNALAAIDSSLI